MKLKLSFFASVVTLCMYAQSAPAYYAGVDFGKTKDELKNELSQLVTTTHTKIISYSELKDLLKVSDVDPDNPANLLLIYGSQSSGKHTRSRSKGGSWNREHVYAQSQGTPQLGQTGAGADGHHLRPADVNLNSDRGHLHFDDGTGALAQTTARGGWYPGDEWKGDVARILMYMYVRWKNQAQPKNITFNPFTYSPDFPDILLKWNVEDPVSAFEIQRNNIVANTQKNRNPFIDNPYLATVIWGGPEAQNTWPDTIKSGGITVPDTEAPTKPANLSVIAYKSNEVTLAWGASRDNVGVVGYTVTANPGGFTTTTSSPGATVTGLESETTYTFHVTAKDAAGNESERSTSVKATTSAVSNGGGTTGTCGTENFDNVPSTGGNPPASSYTDRVWSGNGITWTAVNARTDQQVYINSNADKAVCLKKGSLTSSVIKGGIGSLSVQTFLPFNDAAGNYILKINGEEKGKIPYSKKSGTQTISDINVKGDFVIELIDENTNNRVSFDNLSWTCYSSLGTAPAPVQMQKLSIYPNPVKNYQFTVEGIGKNETLKIYSISGQLLQTINNVKNKEVVRVNRLSSGIYFITGKTQSAKLVIE